MPGRRILANLLWEDDLARRRATPPRTVLQTVSGLATLLRAFAQEGDRLWTPAPVDPERVLAVPGLSRPFLESGPLRELPPADEVLAWGAPYPCDLAFLPPLPIGEEGRSGEGPSGADRQALSSLLWTLSPVSPSIAAAVHHRAFCLQIGEELGCALPEARMVESLSDLDRALSSPRAPRSWVVKAPLSASGRDRYIERRGPKIWDSRSRRTVERLFDRHGSLLFEPWMTRTADFGISALLTQSGLRIVGVHSQRVDARGQFAGVDLQPILSGAERDCLLKTTEAVAAALRRAGYAGPFGVDAWRYRKEGGAEILHPLGEINARMTFGLVAWTLAQRVERATRLLFGRLLPGSEPGTAKILPLLAPGSLGMAAWLE